MDTVKKILHEKFCARKLTVIKLLLLSCTPEHTYLNIDRLASPSGSHKQAGLFVLDQHVHEVGVPDCVLCGHYDGIEQSVLGDGGQVNEGLLPGHPLAHAFLDKVVVVHLSLVRERNGEGLFGSGTSLIEMVFRPEG